MVSLTEWLDYSIYQVFAHLGVWVKCKYEVEAICPLPVICYYF